jgi:hypothetical protein
MSVLSAASSHPNPSLLQTIFVVAAAVALATACGQPEHATKRDHEDALVTSAQASDDATSKSPASPSSTPVVIGGQSSGGTDGHEGGGKGGVGSGEGVAAAVLPMLPSGSEIMAITWTFDHNPGKTNSTRFPAGSYGAFKVTCRVNDAPTDCTGHATFAAGPWKTFAISNAAKTRGEFYAGGVGTFDVSFGLDVPDAKVVKKLFSITTPKFLDDLTLSFPKSTYAGDLQDAAQMWISTADGFKVNVATLPDAKLTSSAPGVVAVGTVKGGGDDYTYRDGDQVTPSGDTPYAGPPGVTLHGLLVQTGAAGKATLTAQFQGQSAAATLVVVGSKASP